MARWTCLFILALAACGGDDTTGARNLCAEGGTLNDTCEDPVDNARDACWRMVDCGAILVHGQNLGDFDWDRCVYRIEALADTEQQIVLACIGASTCDQLKADDHRCLRFGDELP